jgi:hypothetical protein
LHLHREQNRITLDAKEGSSLHNCARNEVIISLILFNNATLRNVF